MPWCVFFMCSCSKIKKMNVFCTDGVVRGVSQAVLCRMPVEVVVLALQNIVRASLYCVPCRAWFVLGRFPRLSSPNVYPVPSVRLMQRMAHFVATNGTASQCEALVNAAVRQVRCKGAPWSWFALDVPVLLSRCDTAAVTIRWLRYFSSMYRGPEQYVAVVLPMLLNALLPKPKLEQGQVSSQYGLALLWVQEHLDATFPYLQPCYRMACVAAMPVPERSAFLWKMWQDACAVQTAQAQAEVLVLANVAGTMQHLLPFINPEKEAAALEHEAVWNWVVRSLQHDRAVLKDALPPEVYACIEKWVPIERTAAADVSTSCCICMDDFAASTVSCVRLRTCGHVFHAACLFKWVVKKKECPMCRESIVSTDVSRPAGSAARTVPFRRYFSGFQRVLGHHVAAYVYEDVLDFHAALQELLEFDLDGEVATSSFVSIEFLM